MNQQLFCRSLRIVLCTVILGILMFLTACGIGGSTSPGLPSFPGKMHATTIAGPAKIIGIRVKDQSVDTNGSSISIVGPPRDRCCEIIIQILGLAQTLTLPITDGTNLPSSTLQIGTSIYFVGKEDPAGGLYLDGFGILDLKNPDEVVLTFQGYITQQMSNSDILNFQIGSTYSQDFRIGKSDLLSSVRSFRESDFVKVTVDLQGIVQTITLVSK